MWITLNDEEINFDLIFKDEPKAKQVMKYLKKTLNKLGYTEEDKGI